MKEQAEFFHVQFWNVICCSGRTVGQSRLVMVLKGEIQLKMATSATQRLYKGNVQIINPNTEYRIISDADNIVLIVDISLLWLLARSPVLSNAYFHIADSTAPDVIKRIGSQLCEVAVLWLKKSSEIWPLEVNKKLLDVFCLLLQYSKTPLPEGNTGSSLSPRIAKAVAWIEDHFTDNISLYQLADWLHVSHAHLSRQFTQETGVNFRTWLIQRRLRQAAQELALTRHTIGQVVSDCGFSSLQRFNKLFRDRYALSPGRWRAGVKTGKVSWQETTHASADQKKKVNPVELFSLLVQYTQPLLAQTKFKNAVRREHISLQPTHGGEKTRTRHYIIAVDSFSELLKQHVQQQLLQLKRNVSSFDVEVGDPITGGLDGPTVLTGEINPTWSPWSDLDLACQFLQKLDVSPVIRIQFEPGSLSLSSYSARLAAFLQHNRMLLGDVSVQRWTFILDIDRTQLLTPENRAALCDTLFRQIRQALPGCRIGIAWHQSNMFPGNLLQQADFIGISVAVNESFDPVSAPEYNPPENQYIIKQLEELVRNLSNQGIARPLYLQSWSTLTGNTLMTNGLFFRGALLMDILLSLPQEVQMLGLWLNSQLQNEVSAANFIENNSLSLFFSANTRRPVFHILALKQRIDGDVFGSGPGWVATRQREKLSVLLLNPVTINPLLSVQQHLLNDYSKRYSLQIALPDCGIWRIKTWLFDQKNGALYYQYGLHPTSYDRDTETMAYINQRSEPTLSVRDERLSTQWAVDLELNINAVCLIQLCKIAE